MTIPADQPEWRLVLNADRSRRLVLGPAEDVPAGFSVVDRFGARDYGCALATGRYLAPWSVDELRFVCLRVPR